ncbi:hypothetical protein XSP_001045 [Xanthomonas euroxanthea]|uniref:Uncharacterized protein n=1 Tax=Xanthomonas euroxanthea TaxID=2259622 RepID=A0A8E4DTZ3_9XANT|nr:hypothetical protein [Xanthomonas euroxanthea]CAD1788742.1 hypothetical protein XSP_001045 [Xanthomonas euroxanthea]SYZ52247.1 hypothetical protein CPBF367_10510 [Xanthomonas arboricola pv. juglandis]
MKGTGLFPRTELLKIKAQPKRLIAAAFTAHQKRRFPPPLHKVQPSRRSSTNLISLGGDFYAAFVARTADTYEKKAMYGFLLRGDKEAELTCLLRLDWHPSHKGMHCIVNCEQERDLSGRNLAGCKELALKDSPVSGLDPDIEDHRKEFIRIFCDVCNISAGEAGLLS